MTRRKRPKDPLVVVLGATATGKSQLAVDLATKFDGEIINGDAMQMYDGLPIVTNKITPDEQKGIPHHLLGFIPLEAEPWRVGMFKREAGKVIKEIRSRGKLPILVGGTHYYTHSLLFNNSLVDDGERETPKDSEEEKTSEELSLLNGTAQEMLEKLKEVDPVMAERWHPNDIRKIRRSLEINLTTGKRASDIYAEQKLRRAANGSNEDASIQAPVANGSTLLFWVHSDSEVLRKRLDSRVETMIQSGLLDEVKSMDAFLRQQTAAGITIEFDKGIWVSIGWKEFVPYLGALRSSLQSSEELEKLFAESVEQVRSSTRQYAKRQIRWIRNKLISALADWNALDKLYLLDSSDAAQFDIAVVEPAIDITAQFLDGDELPAPQELSDAAKTFLALEADPRDTNFRRECELCSIVAVYEDQWAAHLKSRRHRALEKKRFKNAAHGRSHQEIKPDSAPEST